MKRPSRQRSAIMRAVPRKSTLPERLLGAYLKAVGVGHRTQAMRLPGTPDIVVHQTRLAIFVDGCFWHGCPLHATNPKTNRLFWMEKVARNQRRDVRVDRELRCLGWTPLRVWEHRIKSNAEGTALKIASVHWSRLGVLGL